MRFLACVGVAALGLSLSNPARAATCGEVPQVMIVLDRSDSMSEKSDSVTKWDAAGSAVNALVGQFAGQLALGVMLFPRWPTVDSCSYGQVNVGPSLNSGPSISSLLTNASPTGKTPIAATLDEAASYFAAQAGKPRYVILITDGVETCLTPAAGTKSGSCIPILETSRKCGECGVQFCNLIGTSWSSCQADPGGFPCLTGATCKSDASCTAGGTGSANATQAAVALKGAGITTYVVGFGSGVDGSALNAIAVAGGSGSYHQANNLTQLQNALGQIAGTISCCGNGALDAGEQCDTAIAAGQPGACPAACDDADPCTDDKLKGKACQAHCAHTAITAPTDGDGCCPAGATPQTDNDCVDPCGNGVVDTGEQCDTAIGAGQPGACPASCNDNDPCTTDTLTGSGCQMECTHGQLPPTPTLEDGCCPKGMTANDDADCLPPCTPDRTTNCVDPCQDKLCPFGQQCAAGTCVPKQDDAGPSGNADGGLGTTDGGGGSADGAAPTADGASAAGGENFGTSGCSCRTDGGSSDGLILGLALLCLLGRRRRRSTR